MLFRHRFVNNFLSVLQKTFFRRTSSKSFLNLRRKLLRSRLPPVNNFFAFPQKSFLQTSGNGVVFRGEGNSYTKRVKLSTLFRKNDAVFFIAVYLPPGLSAILRRLTAIQKRTFSDIQPVRSTACAADGILHNCSRLFFRKAFP